MFKKIIEKLKEPEFKEKDFEMRYPLKKMEILTEKNSLKKFILIKLS